MSGPNAQVETSGPSDAKDSGLEPLDSPLWEPAFWPARYLAPSTWIEHIPFAFWLVSAVQPRVIVEVGTDSAVSYFAFCQAVERLALQTRCYAIAELPSDAAPDAQDKERFAGVIGYNDDHYSSFSTVIRKPARDAVEQFDAALIDVLHLNLPAETAEARQQFETWLPKLSPRGVVLVANTNPAHGDVALQRAFGELKTQYPAFEFFHGSGLGVVGAGSSLPAALQGLLFSHGDAIQARWQKSFARLGRGHLDRHLLETELKRRNGAAPVSPPDIDAGEKAPESERADSAQTDDLRNQLDEATRRADTLGDEIKHLRAALADEKRRFRAKLREAQQLSIKVRTVQEQGKKLGEAEKQLARADKHLKALRDEVTEKASALTRMGSRVAMLKDEIRRSDRYIAQLLAHFEKRRSRVERRVTALVNTIHAETDLEAVRATILRHENAPVVKALTAGVRATASVDPSGSRLAVYLHYRIKQRRPDAANLALIAASGLFDASYYLTHYEDVAQSGIDPLLHYMDYGAAEHRDPSPYFDTRHYLEAYPDVAEQGVNPLLHFITRGRAEGRFAKGTPSVKDIMGDWKPPEAPPQLVSRDALKPLPKRVVIYTAVAGGYDDLKPPAFRPPHCDFVVFSDQPLNVEGWQVRPLNYLHPDPTRAARFAKLHPHIYFPEYEHSIWIDANINVHGDIREFFRRLNDEIFIGIFVHPLRDCIYVEGEECIKRKKDDRDVITRHVERYREAGFPEHYGLWETNVLVRRHNDPRCIEMMLAWWREMEIGSKRDQISLPVVTKNLSIEIAGLAGPKVDARTHPMLSLVKHPGRGEFDPDGAPPPAVRKPVDLDSISMNIGICVYNSPDETRACLESVAAARRPQDWIVIVDDASAEPTASYLDEFARSHGNVRLVRHPENRGYTASANDVLKNASGDWVVLLNSDTIVAKDAFKKMIVAGEQFPQIGIIGPLSNAASWQTVPQLTGADGKFLVNQVPTHMSIDDLDRLCAEVSVSAVSFVPLVNGFCYAIRRALIAKIGYFDEESFPQGYGEEDDFCLRAGAAGYLCAIAPDAYVFHVKSATFTSDRRKPLVESGLAALRRKHSPERLKAAVETLKRSPELRRLRNRIGERLRELSPPLVPAELGDEREKLG